MKTKYNFLFIAFILIAGLNFYNLKAGDYFDTQGKDFWFSFLPNFHSGGTYEYDSLYVFVTSEYPTNGTIEYFDQFGRKWTRNFQITDPKQIYSLKLFYDDYELNGFSFDGIWTRNESEVVSPKSFHVVADSDVTVYALSQAYKSSDAFLVLPTDVLAGDYFVMSYNSDGNISDYSKTPSQFCIVAPYDNTKIQITPSTETFANNRRTQNITLNKGEVYLVQAKFTTVNDYPDLTGSQIQSDKPVAVFAGHQRSTLPVKIFKNQTSRDCLIEQMLPVKVWGKNALLVPYFQPNGITWRGNDLYRILAAYDSTDVFINNVKIVTLDKGGYYESDLTTSAAVSSNNPILVAQFKKTSNDSTSNRIGDPFMMIIPPVEQFMNKYRVINVQAHEVDYNGSPNIVYVSQFIIIVAHDTATSRVTLDGNLVSASLFKPIPSSNYKYANVPVTDGVHEISCPSEIGLYIYGYGAANSYGYIGGMSFKPLDYLPPEILSTSECYEAKGTVKDTTLNDSKLRIVREIPDSNINVQLQIDPFNPYPPKVGFKANLIDFKKDGKFGIMAEDSIGYRTEKGFEIPGFTVSLNKLPIPDISSLIKDSTIRNKPICFDVEFANYGKFNQTIEELYTFDKNMITISKKGPYILKPGESQKITVCFSSPNDTILIDSLMMKSKCLTRKLNDLNFIVLSDKNAPRVSKISDPCYTSFDIVLTDSSNSDFGIESYKVILDENCNIQTSQNGNKQIRFLINIEDVDKDAYYQIVVSDSSGNQTSVSDTIPGFTLSFPDWSDTVTKIIDFGKIHLGSIVCDTFNIKNYGAFPIKMNNLQLSVNTLFSIPQFQLPVTINPGETKEFRVCFRPFRVDNVPDQDTIRIIWYNCREKHIMLKGFGETEIFTSESQCNVPLRYSGNKLSSRAFSGDLVPNPAINEGKLVFSLPEDSKVTASIYNLMGIEVYKVFSNDLLQGDYFVDFNVSDLPSGTYLLFLTNNKERITRYFIIAR